MKAWTDRRAREVKREESEEESELVSVRPTGKATSRKQPATVPRKHSKEKKKDF